MQKRMKFRLRTKDPIGDENGRYKQQVKGIIQMLKSKILNALLTALLTVAYFIAKGFVEKEDQES